MKNKVMKIVIFGATGGTGKELVKQSLEQNHQVTVFVRSTKKLNISHSNLSVVEGDVSNLGDVKGVISNQELVISALGTKPWETPICSTGIKNITDTMKKYGVNRIIVVSAYGTGKTKKTIHGYISWFVIRNLMKDKEKMEKILRKSGLDWTVVRPVALTRREKSGQYHFGSELVIRKLYPTISRSDVADFILKIVTKNLYLRQAMTISH